ncbi:FAD-dependent oxidoreductase [Streptomyces sp. NPDC017254]|uniref:FAD-dependent oxidoreductase n=1 Tax=unclassified Streptomyces TaxID=2593676 RepID=UPI0037BCD9BD
MVTPAAGGPGGSIRWPGVVVVGAGVTGLLVTERLRQRGVPVLLVEQRGLGAGQTGHCHGYLHRGYIYRRLGAPQQSVLDGCAEWWSRRLAGAGGDAFVGEESVIGFTGAGEREETLAAWTSLGMPWKEVGAPGLAGTVGTFAVPEATVSPRAAVRAVAGIAASTPGVRGRAVLPRLSGRAVSALEILTDEGTLTVSAPAYVLAAGLGTPGLLGPWARALGMRTRLSYMLVCRSGRDLPGAFCLPEDSAQGLFVASRPAGRDRVYLMSTFVNFWPSAEDEDARRSWLGAVSRVLATHVPGLWDDPDARWGLYPAGKIEVDVPDDGGLPEGGVLDVGWDNAVAVLPGKFVLAPLYADRCLDRLARLTDLDRLRDPSPAAAGSPLGPYGPGESSWAAEDWEMTPLFSRAALFDGPGPARLVPAPSQRKENDRWSA